MLGKKARTILELIMIFIVPALVMLVYANAYTAPDLKPILTFTSNTQDADTSAVLTAVAVDTLTNAGISSVELYQDDSLLEKKVCNGMKTCTFSKAIVETNAASHSYYAKTTDLGGNSVQSSLITITFRGIVQSVNLPPSLSAIGGKSLYTNQLLEFTVSGSDPNNDVLTYSANNLPSGATFSNRVFSWTPSYSQAGIHTVTFKVSDGQYEYSETIAITVANANRAPVLDAIGNKNVNENQLLQFTISGSDPDGDSLTYSASNLPSGASFNAGTKTFSWTPSTPGTYQVTFSVTDGNFADSETITISVGDVNHAPVLASIGNKNVNESQLLQFTVSATDEDNDTLTYSTSTLPSGAVFSNKQFSWTPNSTQSGNYQVTFNVSDISLSDSETITITVSDIGSVNHAPVLASIGNKNVNESQLLQFTVSATDEDNDTLTYSTSTLPSGASFNSTTKTFSWTPSTSGSYQVTFNVSDISLSDSETITIFVGHVNSPPVFSGSIVNVKVANAAPGAYTWTNSIGGLFSQLTICRNRNLTFVPTVSDPENDTLTYNWYVDAQPIGGLFSQMTRAFTTAGTYNVTLVVSDSQSSVSGTWIVEVQNDSVYGTITDMDTGANLGGLNISFYPADTFNAETNSSSATGYENLVPKAVPDTQTDAIGGFFMNLMNGRYHVVIQGSKEIDFELNINNTKGKEKHDSEVSEKIESDTFNAEGHIVHSGKYSDSNNYTAGNMVHFTMFGVNNGGTSETISFVIQDHTSSGNPNSPVIYNGSFSNPNETLTITAGQKTNKMFKFSVPANYSAGKYDIHVVWNNSKWHKIGNFFVTPDTTLPYVYGWDSLTTYTNKSTDVPCDGENLPQPGTIGYNEQVYYYMLEGYNEPKWGVKVCVDKDILTDGNDADVITDNDEDGCMINPPRFVGSEDVPWVNWSKSGYYRMKITATDEAGNTNSTYTNVTVLANEAEANATAYHVYSRFFYNDYEQYDYDKQVWSQVRNFKINFDRFDDNATNVGDEYITPENGFHGPNGINLTEIAAAEEANFHFPLGQFVKPIYSMTIMDYNYTLTSFCYHVMCNAGQQFDNQPGCHDENFAPQIMRCTPYGGPKAYGLDTKGFTCVPTDVTMSSSSTSFFGAGGTWGMGFEPAVIDPNADPTTGHWYIDNVEVFNTEDHNYTYMANNNYSLYFVGNSSLVGSHKVKFVALDFSGMNVSILNGPSNSHEWTTSVTA